MSIDVLEESGHQVDSRRLAELSRFVYAELRVHPQADLCIKVVDAATIAELNERYLGKAGPTDVLAFPMDELRPGMIDDAPREGILGDLMLCPEVAERQAAEVREKGRADYSGADELDLLTVHGILHLLGFDHADPDEHAEMFGLQAELLANWAGARK